MSLTTTARLFISPTKEQDRFLPEGPKAVMVSGRQALAWVNIQTSANATTGAVHLRFWDKGELVTLEQPGRPGFMAPTDRPNVVLLGMTHHVGTLDLETNDWQPLAQLPDANPRTIINDGMTLPDGSGVIFGTKDLNFEEPIAKLYYFNPQDKQIVVLADGQICSNGKVFTMFNGNPALLDIDTPRRVVTRYRFDPHNCKIEEEGVAIDVKAVPGLPDGMCDCGDGSAIIAFYNPEAVPFGRAIRYHLQTGEPLEEWQVPGSPRVTCPILVKTQAGIELILTTATEGMAESDLEKCPYAGCIFRAKTAFEQVPDYPLLKL